MELLQNRLKANMDTSSNLISVTNNRISASVSLFPQMYRCLPSISSHLSNASYTCLTACRKNQCTLLNDTANGRCMNNEIISRNEYYCGEKMPYFIIRSLLCCKPTSINTIVYPIVYPFISPINLISLIRWMQIQRSIFSYIIEFRIKHADYLRTLIINNRLQLLIPQYLV